MRLTRTAPWKRLLEKAISVENSGADSSATATIATVDSEGKPRARVVVCRGFLGNESLRLNSEDNLSANLLALSTHLQSPKVDQLCHNKFAELVFWFPKSGEEFRLNCSVMMLSFANSNSLVNPGFEIKDLVYSKPTNNDDSSSESVEGEFDVNALLESSFRSHSKGLHSWFAGPAPGKALANNAQEQEQIPENELLERSRKNFALLVLNPTTVDYVNLASKIHKRKIFNYNPNNNEWIETNVVP